MLRAAAFLLVLPAALYSASASTEAMICVHAKSPDAAITHCTAAITSGKLPSAGLASALGNRCQAYGQKQDYARALPDCERAVQLDPHPALQLYRRGLVRFYSGSPEKAMPDFEQAIRLDSNFALGYVGRASVLAKRAEAAPSSPARLAQYDSAIRDYGEALRIAPDGQTYYARGWCYIEKRSYNLARQDLDEAIRRGVGAGAYYYRGWCSIYQTAYDLAITDFTQSIRLDPQTAVSYSSRAWVYAAQRKFDQSIRDYTEALRRSPDAGTYKARAWVYYHSGAYLLALQDYVRASWRSLIPFLLLAVFIYGFWRRRSARQPQPAPAPAIPKPEQPVEPPTQTPITPR